MCAVKLFRCRAYCDVRMHVLNLAGFPLFSGPLPPGSWTLTMAVDAPDGVYQGTHADTVDVTSL